MGYKCCICKIGYTAGSDVSLHRFPKDEILKRLWLGACCITTILPSYRICDKHFTKESFNESGYLSKKAVPFVAPSGCKRKLSFENITEDHSENSKLNTEELPINISNHVLTEKKIQNLTMITPTSKKIKLFPRYINDLSVDDFITPRRTERNLSFVKKKYNENLKKMYNLQNENKRLTTKVKTLEDLMNVLEKKNLISENAFTLLQVNY